MYKVNQELGTKLNELESSNKDLESTSKFLESSIEKLTLELASLESQRKGSTSLTKKAQRSSSEMSIYVNSKDNKKLKCYNSFKQEVEEALETTLGNLGALLSDYQENIQEIADCTITKKITLK